jgi:hypothetical protein
MASLASKIESELRLRRLLDDNGLPQPDLVEYGHGCVRFLYEEPKVCIVVDIDPPDQEPGE